MKTKKNLSINKLLSIILSAAAIIVYVIGIIKTCTAEEGRALILTNGIITILALIALIVLIVTCKNKSYIIIPLLVLLVTASYYTQTFNSLVKLIAQDARISLPTTIAETSTVMDLLLVATLIVAYVFALKNQKWAKIIVYVILGLMTATLYTSLIQYNILFIDIDIDTHIDMMSFKLLLIGTLITYVAEIVYFAISANEGVSTENASNKAETLEVEETEIK